MTAIRVSNDLAVPLHRTLRVPEDGGHHPLPPSLGTFDVHRGDEGTLVVPIHPREALWLSFSQLTSFSSAVKVGVGAVDAISGRRFDPDRLHRRPQDYVVVPDQPWLDGSNSGRGTVRQFVALPPGTERSVEAQVLGGEEAGGLELVAFRAVEPDPELEFEVLICCPAPMAIGAGGSIRQEIYTDRHPARFWQREPAGRVRIILEDAVSFAARTGRPVPPTPIDAATYAEHGLPWFELYDPVRTDVAPADALVGLRGAVDGGRPLRIEPGTVVTYVNREVPVPGGGRAGSVADA